MLQRTLAKLLFLVAGVVGGLTIWKATRPDGPPLCHSDDECLERFADWQCQHIVGRKPGNTAIRSRTDAFPESAPPPGVADWSFIVACDNPRSAAL